MNDVAEAPVPRRRRKWLKRLLWMLVPVVLVVAAFASGLASWLSARTLSRYVSGVTFAADSGPSSSPAPVGAGPLDVRLGYTALPAIIEQLESRGFEVTRQATVSARFRRLADLGLFPPYEERTQAGLTLLGRHGAVISSHRFPVHVYRSFEDIPAPVRETLVFLENRELLDDRSRYQNPAIDWPRFVAAVANFAGARVLGVGNEFGASTLATQLEKLRHSPDGVTRSAGDKARQMASATLRSYRAGPLTTDARRTILLDYLNALPVGAMPGYGEVIGLREGLRLWFGFEPDSADAALTGESVTPSTGPTYRAVMMLLLAQRRPAYYLQTEEGRRALAGLTDSHLRTIGAQSAVPRALADAALNARLTVRSEPPPAPRMSFVERKAINAARSHVAELLAAPGLYQLDRYDLTAVTTIDSAGQQAVTNLLRRLADTTFVRTAGLFGDRLLGQGDPRAVAYSFVLYERTPRGNALRVQVDNLDRPFDLNLGARLELGSTAKLRTLVSYLQVVAELHAEMTDTSRVDTLNARPTADDPISVWVREYMRAQPATTAEALLDAAMQRRYSASPTETFFTGGGTHVFGNFDASHNRETLTVLEGFRHSVNLVFVRLMRDVVRYHERRLPEWEPNLLVDASSAARRELLARYADAEGRAAIDRAFRRHRGLPPDSSVALLAGTNRTPPRYARVLFAVAPAASDDELRAALASRYSVDEVDAVDLRAVRRAVPASLSLADRAYVTGTDPLELWVVARLRETPDLALGALQDQGATARQDAYAWLFRNTAAVRRAQDRALRTTLERDAFQRILASWRTVGYPYDNIVPSFGTSIGSSGDRPGALAELVGIVIGDGIRRPPIRVEELRFGEGTPFEVVLKRDSLEGHRVMTSEVAAAVRSALLDVVSNGTAAPVRDALADAGLAIGGKTGTGDNVVRTAASGGRPASTRTLSRTATFVFSLGDRFYGAATAYVEGPAADQFTFTSGLPVRVVRLLLPELGSLISDGSTN